MAKADDKSGKWSMVKPSNVFARVNVVSSMANFILGYDLGVMSGVLLLIKDDFLAVKNSNLLQETIVKMALLGILTGFAVGWLLNKKYGLNKCILAADVFCIIGAGLMASAPGPYFLIFGRFLCFFGVGLATITSVFYVQDTLPKEIGCAFIVTHNLMLISGQLSSFLILYALSEVDGAWRWMVGLSSVPAILQFCLMFYLPESPAWLAMEKSKSEAAINTCGSAEGSLKKTTISGEASVAWAVVNEEGCQQIV